MQTDTPKKPPLRKFADVLSRKQKLESSIAELEREEQEAKALEAEWNARVVSVKEAAQRAGALRDTIQLGHTNTAILEERMRSCLSDHRYAVSPLEQGNILEFANALATRPALIAILEAELVRLDSEQAAIRAETLAWGKAHGATADELAKL